MGVETVAAQRKGRIFLGWWMVLVGFLTDFINFGVGFYGFSLFIVPMSDELGWSRTLISFGVFLKTAIMAFIGPILGPLIDKKHGPRLIMSVAGFAAGLGFIVISMAHAPWQFFLGLSFLGAIGLIASQMYLGGAIVAKWFIRRRGRAMALSTSGIAIGGMAMPLIIHALMDAFGWRAAWFSLGLVTWVLIIPLAALFIRRRPEDVGLRPDGIEAPDEGSPSKTMGADVSYGEQVWTLRQAVRTKAMWMLILVTNLIPIAVTGVMIHMAPFLQDMGLSSAVIPILITVSAFFALTGKLSGGFSAERVHVRYLLTLACILSATGVSVALVFGNATSAIFFVVVTGIGWGGTGTLQPLAWANYFGRTFLGTIRGVMAPLTLVANAAGPVFSGWIYDRLQNYDKAFIIFVIFWAMAAVVMFFAKPPRLPEERDVNLA